MGEPLLCFTFLRLAASRQMGGGLKLGLRLALAMLVAMVPLPVRSLHESQPSRSEGRRDGLALTANAHAAFVTTWVQGRVRSLEVARRVSGTLAGVG